MRGLRVFLSTSAAAALQALGSRPRGMLITALVAAAASQPRDGLLSLWAADQVAVCEIIASDRVVLVYAIRSADALRDALYGEWLHLRFRRLGIRRVLHDGLRR
jgi:hypothetical protein